MSNRDVQRQKRLVLAGYVVQIVVMLITFGMPLALIVPIVYPVVIRRFVTIDWLRRHVRWQLVTVGVGVATVFVATLLLSVGWREINRDTTIVGIVSQWSAIALFICLPPWTIYRFVRGLILYAREQGMTRLWPQTPRRTLSTRRSDLLVRDDQDHFWEDEIRVVAD